MFQVEEKQIEALILGHAIGDALGVPVEFQSRAELVANPVREMRGFGTYDVPAGSWSDDTSMTLALLESLARVGHLDLVDVMENFRRWMDEAAFTPTDTVFDMGRTCGLAVINFKRGFAPKECGGQGESDNGNGSLMRIAPMAPYFYARCGKELSDEAIGLIHDVSAMTHAHPRSQMACGIYTLIAVNLLDGEALTVAIKEGLVEAYVRYGTDKRFRDELATYKRLWNVDAFRSLSVEDIRSSGYVVDTLEAVIYCLLTTDNYEECVLKAVNLGEDTDTVGAIAGGLAGLAYGLSAIPPRWSEALLKKEQILQLCRSFADGLPQNERGRSHEQGDFAGAAR